MVKSPKNAHFTRFLTPMSLFLDKKRETLIIQGLSKFLFFIYWSSKLTIFTSLRINDSAMGQKITISYLSAIAACAAASLAIGTRNGEQDT